MLKTGLKCTKFLRTYNNERYCTSAIASTPLFVIVWWFELCGGKTCSVFALRNLFPDLALLQCALNVYVYSKISFV